MAYSLDIPINKNVERYIVNTLVQNPSFLQKIRDSPHVTDLVQKVTDSYSVTDLVDSFATAQVQSMTKKQIMWHLVSLYVKHFGDGRGEEEEEKEEHYGKV